MTNQVQYRAVKSFLLKSFLLLLPFIVIIAAYFYFDPFHILYPYENYSYNNYYDDQPYELNREIISSRILSQNREKFHYNSFILGSCESYVFHADSWKKYLKPEDAVFHFPAASETITGVSNKLEYLDNIKMPVKNCLVVLDISTFKQSGPRTSTIHIADPDISGESRFSFHKNMLRNFFSNMFCIQYMDYKLTGKIKSYMKNNFAIVPGDVAIAEESNEYYYAKYDRLIKQDSIQFYKDKKRKFYYRDTINPVVLRYPVIKEEQLKELQKMKVVFDKQKTDYYIILSPMYDQVAFNNADLKILENTFGKERVFNYSGINKYTKDNTCYYDNFHYKPAVANEIMSEIYDIKNNKQ